MQDRDKLRIPEESRKPRNGWFIAAGVVGVSAFAPFAVALILNELGVQMGTGLGFGLLLWAGGFLAAMLFIIGAVAELLSS